MFIHNFFFFFLDFDNFLIDLGSGKLIFLFLNFPGRMVNHNFSHHVSFNRSKPEGSHMKIVQTVNSLDKLCDPLTHLPS